MKFVDIVALLCLVGEIIALLNVQTHPTFANHLTILCMLVFWLGALKGLDIIRAAEISNRYDKFDPSRNPFEKRL